MAQFMRDLLVLEADVIAIQEPWKNLFQDTIYHSANKIYQLLYPTVNDIGAARVRVCLYISRKIDPRFWKHTVHSADCQEIEIQHRYGRLRIINLYNSGPWDKTGTSMIDTLEHVVNRKSQEYIILGDFNLRYPAWNDPDARDTPDPGIWDADSDQPDGNTGRQSAPADFIDRYDSDAELTPEEQRVKGLNRRTR